MGGQHGLGAAGRRGRRVGMSLPGLEDLRRTSEQPMFQGAQEGWERLERYCSLAISLGGPHTIDLLFTTLRYLPATPHVCLSICLSVCLFLAWLVQSGSQEFSLFLQTA